MSVYNDAQWRVSLSLNAETRCPIESSCEVEHDGITLEVIRSDTGLIKLLKLTCLTLEEFVPIFSKLGKDSPIKYRIDEPKDVNRDRLIEAALRFEGVFTPFGMKRLDFSRPEWQWHYLNVDAKEWQLHFSNRLDSEAAPIMQEEMLPGTLNWISKIALNSAYDKQALTLTLSRDGHNSFFEDRYIDAIRSFYLSIEHQCAEGQSGRKQTVAKLSKSRLLGEAIQGSHISIRQAVTMGDISQGIVDDLLLDRSQFEIADWMFLLRGGLFHQKGNRSTHLNWNPSNHMPHKHNAIILRGISAAMTVRVLTPDIDWSMYESRIE